MQLTMKTTNADNDDESGDDDLYAKFNKLWTCVRVFTATHKEIEI